MAARRPAARRRPPARRTGVPRQRTRPRRPAKKHDGGGVVILALVGLGIVAAILQWMLAHIVLMILLGIVAAGAGVAYRKHSVKTRLAVDRARWSRVSTIAEFRAMTPVGFEHAIADLCRRDGCTNVRVVGGAGDLGADVIATLPDGRRLVIQAKRYGAGTAVGSPDLQRVGGTAVQVHGAHVTAVVTTSRFTKAATDYARQVGIRCADEHALARWAARTGPAPWH